MLLGAGTAMVYPTLLAAIGDVAHPSWRARSVGVYRLWRDGGFAVGALLAGVIADLLGLSAAIYTVAAITAASGARGRGAHVRDPPPRSRDRPRPRRHRLRELTAPDERRLEALRARQRRYDDPSCVPNPEPAARGPPPTPPPEMAVLGGVPPLDTDGDTRGATSARPWLRSITRVGLLPHDPAHLRPRRTQVGVVGCADRTAFTVLVAEQLAASGMRPVDQRHLIRVDRRGR